jgi:hypothetical protein
VAALLWLALRTGAKPSRVTYPCQRAALGSLLVLGLPLSALVGLCARQWRDRAARLAAGAALVTASALGGVADTADAPRPAAAPAPPRTDYWTELFVVQGGGPDGDHHRGIDALIACAGAGGLAFHRSAAPGPSSGPDGIVGPGDVVLIKVNQQWPERGGTNTDVLRGLIARILEHPDGFTGEVVIVENTQNMGRMDWPASNAEDHGQSVAVVVAGFAGQGAPVSVLRWDPLRAIAVGEYSDADARDGYVVGVYHPTSQVRVSYPKFRTAGGAFVSLKRGIWSPDSARYGDRRLTFLNLPVLKCHSIYGVTGALKNHVGTMTTALSTNTHAAVLHGGLGTFLGEVRMPDLNILDATWVLAHPDRGPACGYAEATRLDALVAGRDPVALDLWATTHLLVPAIEANGYQSYPQQDPDNPSGVFRTYLDNATRELLAAGIGVANQLGQVVVHGCSVTGLPVEATAGTGPRAHPNPFTTSTTIRFAGGRMAGVRVEIHDVLGRRRRVLEAHGDGALRQVIWDGRDHRGQALPAGTYYYRVRGAGTAWSGKVTLER